MGWETSAQGIENPIFIKGVRPDNDLHSNYTDPEHPNRNIGLYENEKNRAIGAVLTELGTTAKVDYNQLSNVVTNFAELDAFIIANASNKTVMNISGIISFTQNYSIPKNIKVSPQKNCMLTPSAGITVTISNITRSLPDFQWIDLSANGALIQLPIDINPGWIGAVCDGITDDYNYLVKATTCAALNHKHVLIDNVTIATGSDPNLNNVKFQNGGIIKVIFAGACSIGTIAADPVQIFDCTTPGSYIKLLRQSIAIPDWWGVERGNYLSDAGISATLASKALSSYGSVKFLSGIESASGEYFFITPMIIKNSHQSITSDGDAILRTLNPGLSAIIRCAHRNEVWTTCPITNNGGLVRITKANHCLNTGDTIVVSGSEHNNGSYTVTKIDYQTFDLVASAYVHDDTCTITFHIDDGGQSHVTIEKLFLRSIQTNPYYMIDIARGTDQSNGGVSEFKIKDNHFYCSTQSTCLTALNIHAGWGNEIRGNRIEGLYNGINLYTQNNTKVQNNKFYSIAGNNYCNAFILSEGCNELTIEGNDIEHSSGIILSGWGRGIEIRNNRFESGRSTDYDILVTDNITDKGGVITGITIHSLKISGNSSNSTEAKFFHCNVTSPDSRLNGSLIEDNLMGYGSINSVPLDKFGEYAAISFDVISYEQLDTAIARNVYINQNTNVRLDINGVSAIVGGKSVPIDTVVFNKGCNKLISTSIFKSIPWNPGVIANGATATKSFAVPRVDLTHWICRGGHFDHPMPAGMHLTAHITEMAALEDVAFRNNGNYKIRGHYHNHGLTDYQQIRIVGTDYETAQTWIKRIDADNFDCPEITYADPEGWLPGGWSYRIKHTIQYEKVAGTISDYTYCINLTALSDSFWSYVENDGPSLRATLADGVTECPIDVVSCDTAAKTGSIWIKIGTLSSTQDTIIYLYHYNPNAQGYAPTDPLGRNAVWGIYGKIMHHFENSILNSTGNTDPTDVGTHDQASGLIGHARQWISAHSDHLNYGNVYNPEAADFTFVTWIKTTASSGNIIMKQGTSGYYSIGCQISGGRIYVYLSSNGTSVISLGPSAASVNDGNWHQVAFRKSGQNCDLIIDGVVDQTTANAPVSIYKNDSVPLVLGIQKRQDGGLYGAFNGDMDCIMFFVGGTALSANFIHTLQHNINETGFDETEYETTTEEQIGDVIPFGMAAQITNNSGSQQTIGDAGSQLMIECRYNKE